MFGRKLIPPNITDRVRRVLSLAREEAIALRHDYVGTEHILLGLIREGQGMGAGIFMETGIDPQQVKSRVLEVVRTGKATVSAGELPYTSRAKKTLEYAMQSSYEMRLPYVGTEHLLLGLMMEEKGIGAQILASFGLEIPQVKALVKDILSREPGDVGPVSTFTIDVDDTSDKSIYEQIIARVQEGVATGSLQSGERLPAVRQLADRLNIAPGTVARAYSELERLRVVVTEGARGTRIADRARGLSHSDRAENLTGLLRPVVVAAFHLGANADELRAALERAMAGILVGPQLPN